MAAQGSASLGQLAGFLYGAQVWLAPQFSSPSLLIRLATVIAVIAVSMVGYFTLAWTSGGLDRELFRKTMER